MMALYWRDARGGTGQHIDASLYEPVLLAISHAVSRWRPGKPPPRLDSRIPGLPVRNVYATSDGRYVVSSTTTPRHRAEILKLAGAAPDTEDSDAAVAAWIRTQPLDTVLDKATAMRLPVAPVMDLEMLMHDPHVQARGSLVRHRDPKFGEMAVAAPSPRLSATPGELRTLETPLGGHNDEVYGALLGYDAQRLAALRADSVI
jgi:formyl-CoA transferase